MNNINKGEFRRSQYLTFFLKNKSYNAGQLTGLILGPLLFILTLLTFEPENLSYKGVLY